jgi:hypothetical protein
MLANRAAVAFIGKPWSDVKGRTDLQYMADRTQAEGADGE